jgi:type I restriction enzyme S subunit
MSISGGRATPESDLPEGWAAVRLGQITTKLGSGATPRGGSESYHAAGIPLIRSMNVHFDGFREDGLAFLDDAQAEALKEVAVEPGDVLLNITGASIGRVTQVPKAMTGARVNQHVCIIRLVPPIHAGYLAKYLSAPLVQDMIMTAEYGLTRQALTKGQILGFEIPVPPLAEQKRIVAKVEELLGRVGAARERLARVPALLKRFRQSILAAACSGQLTAAWRETQTAVTRDNDRDPPPGWRRTTLGEAYTLERGRFLARPRDDPRFYGGPYPFIQIGNLPPEGGLIAKYTQTLNEGGLRISRMFPKGTPLIAIVGATIGNTGVLGFDSCAPDSMVAIRAKSPVEGRYVEFYLRMCKLDVRESSYASGGQPNINLQTLTPYPITLPPLGRSLVCFQGWVRRGRSLLSPIERGNRGDDGGDLDRPV